MSQILVRKLRKQSADWKLYQKALDRIAVSNFIYNGENNWWAEDHSQE